MHFSKNNPLKICIYYKHPVRKMLKNIFSKISVDNFFGAKYNKDIEYQF